MISAEHFTFTRHRAGSPDLAFRPDGVTSLSFGSMSDDTLSLDGMRPGVLRVGDGVSAARGGETVFRGDVDGLVWRGWRGASTGEALKVYGPWRRMSRLPLTQLWTMMVERTVDGVTASALEQVGSSRVVLNQGDTGLPVTLRAQVLEILAAAAARGIIAAPAAGDVAAIPEGMTLPYDEARDLTCAQALARVMRFTPALAVRFDYAANPPALRIVAPSEDNAAWLADFALDGALLEVKETQSGLPPLGCQLEITVTGSVDGSAYAFSSAQSAGDTSDPERTLRAVLPVSGAQSSADRRRLDIVTHEIPSDLASEAFWRMWHADLRLIPSAALKIRNASRTGVGDLSHYPRFLATAGVGTAELEEAGIAHFRAERLLCTAAVTPTVQTADAEGAAQSIEHTETADLSLEIIATDAETKTYRWTASSDSTAGETVPLGLAAALLDAHRADGLSAEVLCALKAGADLPRIGDTRNGLTAHGVSVDCRALTASVGFGPPAALGPVDLAGFLSGFRNVNRSTIHTSRATGGDSGSSEADGTFVLPATSSGWVKRGDNKSEWAPDGTAGGKATIDPADLGSGETARFREITFTDGNGKAAHALVLATEPADGKGDDPGGTGEADGEEECSHNTDPDGGGGGGGGWGDGSESEGGDSHYPDERPDEPGGGDGGSGYDDHEASDPPSHPGKTGPCW